MEIHVFMTENDSEILTPAQQRFNRRLVSGLMIWSVSGIGLAMGYGIRNEPQNTRNFFLRQRSIDSTAYAHSGLCPPASTRPFAYQCPKFLSDSTYRLTPVKR